jgi:hypothetical protein
MEIVLVLVCLALILCPNRYDPAIRLKVWLESKRTK